MVMADQIYSPPKMTKEQAEDFFGILFRGKNHIPSELKPFGHGWKVNAHASMSTFDFDELTRLVFLCHDRCVRAVIIQGGPGRVGIAISQRLRDGDVSQRHPTIDQALEAWRKCHPVVDEDKS